MKTDALGNVSFMFHTTRVVPVGQVVTATSTDPNNNTSEFSRPAKAVTRV